MKDTTFQDAQLGPRLLLGKFDEFGDVHLYRKLKFLVEEPLQLPTEAN
jgi:hypothetical protein